MIYRVRYMFETTKHITIVFIDHIINTSIVKQTTFINNNMNKLNFRLMKTFIYLF